MARLNVVDPATATGKAKEIFDGPLAKKKLNIFRGIANNGGVLEAFLGFAGGVKAGSLTPAQHEVIALAVGQANGCDYCLAAHTKVAGGVGLDVAETVNIRKGTPTDTQNAAIARFATSLVEKKGYVSDEELAEFRAAGFSDDAIVEVIGGVAVNVFTNLFNHVNSTEIDTLFDPAPAI